jgi:hypothetical protein
MVRAPTTVRALLLGVRGATSPGVERGIGVLLGADPHTVGAAVTALLTAGRLGDGLATPALVHAARRGTDVVGAIALIADGAPLPDGWSGYELRSARAEAADDLRSALPTSAGTSVLIPTGPDAPTVLASAVRRAEVGAVHLGATAAHALDALTLRRALVDAAWAVRLAELAGVEVRPRPGAPADLAAVLDGPGDAPLPPGADAGLDEVHPRTAAHLGIPP